MFHLITGGSGSGKSEYAEQKLMEYASHSKRNKKRYYIATMIPFGKETEEKIARHRKLRAGKGFETIECYTDLKKAAEILQTKETGSVLRKNPAERRLCVVQPYGGDPPPVECRGPGSV